MYLTVPAVAIAPLFAYVATLVSFPTSTFVSALQPSNIFFMDVTLSVSQSASIVFRDALYAYHSEESAGRNTLDAFDHQ